MTDLTTWAAMVVAVLAAIGCVYYAVQTARAVRQTQAALAEAQANTQQLIALRRRPPAS